jgi:phosphohistidine phosphatase SixA
LCAHGIRLVLAWFALLGVVSTPSVHANPKPELVSELLRGGLVLFVRHLNTEPDQADTDPLHLDNVRAQRQLTAEGRERATALGAALRTLGIPVERVLSSRFKRALDTAELLGLGPVEGSLELSEGGLVVSPHENQRRAAALKALLGRAPSAGRNLVIVSHRPNLQDAAGKELGDIAEGEIAVFRPLGADHFTLLGRAPADEWLRWASATGKAVLAAPKAKSTRP